LDSIATSTATITESAGKLRDTSDTAVVSYTIDYIPSSYGLTVDSLVSRLNNSVVSGDFTILMNNLAAGGALSSPAKSTSFLVSKSSSTAPENQGEQTKSTGDDRVKSSFNSPTTFWYLIYGLAGMFFFMGLFCICFYSYRKYSLQSGKLEIVKNEIPTFHRDSCSHESSADGEELYDKRKSSSDRGSHRSGEEKQFYYF
jgi:hypothetical protein